MHRVFFDLLDRGVIIYLDDILVYSKGVEEHKVLLEQVFKRLNDYKLYVKAEKCALFLESVEYLGHTIDKNGLHVESGKIKALVEWPDATNITEVQSFMGLCNYYRKFVPRFSELAAPLTYLTRKNIKFEFGDEQKKAFELLKKALSLTPCLKLFDRSLDTRIVCDASDYCVGAILEQKVDSMWHPVEFFSKRLTSAERGYSATEREFVAIKMCLERWRHFLIGIKFTVLSDHAALTYLTKQSHLNRRQARWLDFFQEFAFDITHIPGKKNVADYLSRILGMQFLVLVSSSACIACT